MFEFFNINIKELTTIYIIYIGSLKQKLNNKLQYIALLYAQPTNE